MAFRFLQMPARGCEQTEQELNAFLRSHRILHVDRKWVEVGENSFWAVCIDYLEGSGNAVVNTLGNRRGSQVDYKEVLSPEEFHQFSELRRLRKDLATENAIPVYSVMTNEQIARIVQEAITDRAGLLKIPGLGQSKVDKYGERILAMLQSIRTHTDETSRPSV